MSQHVYAVAGGVRLAVDPAILQVEWARDDVPATAAAVLRDADAATLAAAEIAARRAVRTLREAARAEDVPEAHRERLRLLAAGLWEEWRFAAARRRPLDQRTLPGLLD